MSISFYPDLEKNKEFLVRLQNILNKENSSISDCTIQESISNELTVFLTPTNPQYQFTTICFNFARSFMSEVDSENDYQRYLTDGLSKEDIDSLNELFKEFTFTNYFEASFFASKFFLNKEGYPSRKTIILKFTPSVKKNQYMVNNLKVSKNYTILTKEELNYTLSHTQITHENLLELKTHLRANTEGKHIEKMKEQVKSYPKEEFVLVEYLRDLENYKQYIASVSTLDGEQLKQLDLKSILNT